MKNKRILHVLILGGFIFRLFEGILLFIILNMYFQSSETKHLQRDLFKSFKNQYNSVKINSRYQDELNNTTLFVKEDYSIQYQTKRLGGSLKYKETSKAQEPQIEEYQVFREDSSTVVHPESDTDKFLSRFNYIDVTDDPKKLFLTSYKQYFSRIENVVIGLERMESSQYEFYGNPKSGAFIITDSSAVENLLKKHLDSYIEFDKDVDKYDISPKIKVDISDSKINRLTEKYFIKLYKNGRTYSISITRQYLFGNTKVENFDMDKLKQNLHPDSLYKEIQKTNKTVRSYKYSEITDEETTSTYTGDVNLSNGYNMSLNSTYEFDLKNDKTHGIINYEVKSNNDFFLLDESDTFEYYSILDSVYPKKNDEKYYDYSKYHDWTIYDPSLDHYITAKSAGRKLLQTQLLLKHSKYEKFEEIDGKILYKYIVDKDYLESLSTDDTNSTENINDYTIWINAETLYLDSYKSSSTYTSSTVTTTYDDGTYLYTAKTTRCISGKFYDFNNVEKLVIPQEIIDIIKEGEEETL